jgi:hypothetical protein
MFLKQISTAITIVVLLGVHAAAPLQIKAAPAEAALEETLTKARVNGKYRMLLRQFKAEKDAETNGDFKDLGLRDVKEHAGQADLPKGYWVYAKPYWYIWRDLASVKREKRPWGPEQATGEPDTNDAGDIQTAWASASPDDQDEWLMLEYDELIAPTAIDVYETFNPGALMRITAFKLDGEEVELWKGKDPTPAGSDKGISSVPVKANFKTNRIKIYLDSKAVAGWNEIDAVGVHDKNKVHWAVAAEASSTYAPPFADLDTRPVPVRDGSIARLEREVQALKAQLVEMQKQMKKDREQHVEEQERVLKSLDDLKKLLQKEKEK